MTARCRPPCRASRPRRPVATATSLLMTTLLLMTFETTVCVDIAAAINKYYLLFLAILPESTFSFRSMFWRRIQTFQLFRQLCRHHPPPHRQGRAQVPLSAVNQQYHHSRPKYPVSVLNLLSAVSLLTNQQYRLSLQPQIDLPPETPREIRVCVN